MPPKRDSMGDANAAPGNIVAGSGAGAPTASMPNAKVMRTADTQADRDIFLQAFEKPTQIYRYLRTRNLVSPIFLNRTLTYMSQRMSRDHKLRNTFKVDSLLADKLKATKSRSCYGNFMTIMIQGLFGPIQSSPILTSAPATPPEDVVLPQTIHIEVLLLKISQKKRKESSSTSLKHICTLEVDLNPTEPIWDQAGELFPTVSIDTELLDFEDGPVTQMVLFKTKPLMPKMELNQIYSSELMIFDKSGRCLLTEGEYQLSLQEVLAQVNPAIAVAINSSNAAQTTKSNCSPKKYSSWENLSLFNSDSSGFEDQFEKQPVVKFQLYWTEHSHMGLRDRMAMQRDSTRGHLNNENKENSDTVNVTDEFGLQLHRNINNNNNVANNDCIESQLRRMGHEIFGVPANKLHIAFHFVYNNVSHQTTELTTCKDCPWCNLNCMSLYSLLKHLKLCHARFTFNFVQAGSTARIEVAINEMFDGSYTGSPHNLTGPAGYAFQRPGPVRRTIVTHILVCRPRRSKPSLTEFVEPDENELNSQRPYITGHNRLYHHTMTCLPVHPKELDIDSEGECDPPWLQQKTMMMIDEFTDVNEGEKELMKMWNLHVMKYGFVGDCQISLACDMFVENKGREVLQKNLYRNFVIHMCSLFDYGLVSPDALHKTIQKLQKILNDSQEAKQIIYRARNGHLDHWNGEGFVRYQQAKEKEALAAKELELVAAAATSRATVLEKKSSEGNIGSKPVTMTRSKDSFQKPRTESNGNRNNGGGVMAGTGPVAVKTAAINGQNKRKAATSNGRTTGNAAGHRQYLEPSAHSIKRKLGKESSPARRRSADTASTDTGTTEKRARLDQIRRKSIAISDSISKRTVEMTTKTRFSMSLTKVDRDQSKK